MCSTASFSVDTFDVNDSQFVSWNHTTLVEMESKLPLSLSFVHEGFADVTALVNDSIGLVLDSSFLFLGE